MSIWSAFVWLIWALSIGAGAVGSFAPYLDEATERDLLFLAWILAIFACFGALTIGT